MSYLYLLGSTVVGHKSKAMGVSQETDPSGSSVMLNGKNLTEYRSTITITSRKGNVILSQKDVTYQNWQVSAVVHTHEPGNSRYSIGHTDILGDGSYTGDYGISAGGISVYLVPTSEAILYRMFRLDLSPDDKTNDGSAGIFTPGNKDDNGHWTGWWQHYETYEQRDARVGQESAKALSLLIAGAVTLPFLAGAGIAGIAEVSG